MLLIAYHLLLPSPVKTRHDPRHLERQKTVQDLFEWSFRAKKFSNPTFNKVIASLNTVDQCISKAAPLWPLSQISKIDLAILRLSVYELLVDKSEPPKVVIDEAVELGKEFGGETSGRFINGVLGTVIKNK